jgi:two-component system, sensor histidine kinase and response regulator
VLSSDSLNLTDCHDAPESRYYTGQNCSFCAIRFEERRSQRKGAEVDSVRSASDRAYVQCCTALSRVADVRCDSVWQPSQTGDPLLLDAAQQLDLPCRERNTPGREDHVVAAGQLLDERCRHCRSALASAAHDLNTPITVLAGYVELLQDVRLGPVTETQQVVLNDISEHIERLRRFTTQFLSFHRAQSGVTLNLSTGQINKCVTEVVAMWAPRFDRKGVAHYFVPASHVPPFDFDYDKTQHVISNLLDNALKYTAAGGSIWVQTEAHMWERRTYAGTYSGADRRQRQATLNTVRINVCDTGPGISPEFHEEIFEEFRRLDSSNSDGSGLGLAIARQLVEAHHGKIWVESIKGQGSKFSFLLPLRSRVKHEHENEQVEDALHN